MDLKKTIDTQYGIILLAAGGSSRLGRPKQLLSYQGQTLVQYSAQEALASGVGTVVIVVGANADRIQPQFTTNKVKVIINDSWQEGMASSIRSGINTILEINSLTEGVILMTCDQPYVTATLLQELITAHQKTGKAIVTCSYGDTFGPPVFFHRSFFSELLQLKGDVGARSIIKQHTDDVEAIPFPKGSIDIDTDEDYENIKKDI